MEREPVDFLVRKMTPLVDESRDALAELIGADPADVVFVQNATAGVNSVLRSLDFRPGDEILVTDHDYNACRNVIRYVAERTGRGRGRGRRAAADHSPQQVVDAVLERVTPRTRLAMLDHITSPTALVFPIEELVRELDRRGIDTLVDGAHAPGMVPLDMNRHRGGLLHGQLPQVALRAEGGRAFCTCGAIGSRAFSRRSSATAGTGRGRAIRRFKTPSTGRARSIRRPGCASARRFDSSAS